VEGCWSWNFKKKGHVLNVRTDGQLAFNNGSVILRAALAGFGLAFVPEDMAQEHIAKGRLKQVLEDWCAPFPGYYLYYPSRRQSS
jgi:DNA-binding transcriptional LysR family regulator